jgi:cytochrome P450
MTVLNEVRKKVANGTAVPCTATYGLSTQEELGMNDIELAYALSAPWAAGIETTTTALEIAILAMLHFPQFVRKAQDELDEVVGQDLMPNFDDQKLLPYLDAFIKETLRYVAPRLDVENLLTANLVQTANSHSYWNCTLIYQG